MSQDLPHHNPLSSIHVSREDEAFAHSVETAAASPESFGHKEHVRLAYVYLCQHDLDAAYHRMRATIQAFLAHHGVAAAKYHETITRAWLMAVRYFMTRSAATSSAAAFIAANPELLDSSIMLTHYSAQTLFSDEARAEFVEPDLDPIPRPAS